MKRMIIFYWVSIFMLVNGALFTWLLQSGFLNVWRQALWSIGLVLMFKFLRNICDENHATFTIIKQQMAFFLMMIVFSMFTWILQGFNVLRLAYAVWMYFSGIPFLLFPCLLIWNKVSPKTMFSIFGYLGLFLSVGIMVDYFMGGAITVSLGVAGFKTTDAVEESGRYCFLSESPTTFSVYYVFCLICLMWRMYRTKQQIGKLFLFLSSILYVIGAWFTGSRQMVAVLAGTWLLALCYYLLFVRDRKRFMLAGLLIFAFAATTIVAFLFQDKSSRNRYSYKTLAKDNRSILWEKGYAATLGSPEWGVFFWGKGVGMTQGQKAVKGELTMSHYENTFFSRMVEVGFVGIIMLLYPFIYFMRRASIHSFADVLLFCFFSSYLFICYVSPNGSHQTTQMVIFLALGLVANKEYFFPTNQIYSNELEEYEC